MTQREPLGKARRVEITGLKNYRTLLREELEARCQRNPRYSLRSFARDLALSPSRLSDVLRGRYGFSREAAEKIGRRLGWNDREISRFCDLVESEHARAGIKRAAARARITAPILDHQQLTLDAFQIVSDWYHFAILELTSVRDFDPRASWIAKRLGLSEHIVISAVARLKRLDLIEEKRGRLVARDGFTASPDGIPSDAIKKFHRQILEKAAAAITLQSAEERDFSSMILAIDQSELPEAREEIKRFRRGFDRRFGKAKTKSRVYCLGIQLFNLETGSPPEMKG